MNRRTFIKRLGQLVAVPATLPMLFMPAPMVSVLAMEEIRDSKTVLDAAAMARFDLEVKRAYTTMSGLRKVVTFEDKR